MIEEFPDIPIRYSTKMPATYLQLINKYAKKMNLFYGTKPMKKKKMVNESTNTNKIMKYIKTKSSIKCLEHIKLKVQ